MGRVNCKISSMGYAMDEANRDHSTLDKPQIGPKTVVYRNRYKHIYRVEADFGDYKKEYFVTDGGVRSGMLAVKDDSALLVRQYRFIINDWAWEIPGGNVDEGESPEEAAVRECLEETGSLCFNPHLLIKYHVSLDSNYNPTYIFYAHEIAREMDMSKQHVNEINSCSWIPFEDCLRMVDNGEIVDSFSIIALTNYQRSIRGDGSSGGQC
jgi:8-oxo-dGTP pyrophosphatase MutT (NUDIX family)